MIEVISTGIFTTIQDLGRFEFRQMGVPLAGAMDQYSGFVANSLVGNCPSAALLEITFKGPELRFHQNTTIAVAGAKIPIKLNDEYKIHCSAISVNKGDKLTLGTTVNNARSYLAVAGGFQTEIAMKSRSFYPEMTSQMSLTAGTFLAIKSTQWHELKYQRNHRSVINQDSKHFNNTLLYVYPGPEFYDFKKHFLAKIFRKKFKIDTSSNRMAYQFTQQIKLDNKEPIKEILTSSVQPGTVQITPGGDVIALMRDCQTTGGYARIFQMCGTSINQLAQKMPHSEVSFYLLPDILS